MEKYMDTSLTANERAKDLLSKLSVREKVRQISCSSVMMFMPPEMQDLEDGTGAATIGFTSDGRFVDDVRTIQDYVIEHSPHRIPALFHTEGLAGPLCLFGGNQYPISIGLGATFEPEIVQKMSEHTRRQLLANGVRHALSPVSDLARDLRWGRCNETYGGDPTLSSAMTVAFVKGMQGDDPKTAVASCCKHFLGYSMGEGALNCHQTLLSYNQIREQFAKPFEAAIHEANVMTIMNSYAIVNGRPVTANKAVLTDLLRNDLHFGGAVVADYGSISQIKTPYCLAENNADAARIALEAGLDVELPDHVIYSDELVEAVEEGRVDIALVDRAAERMLTLKFELGLFENPYSIGDYDTAMDNTEANKGSLEAALKSMTLLKNDGILPLTSKEIKVALIGPAADSLRMMYSHYTATATREMIALLMSKQNAKREDADFTNVLNQGREEDRQIDGGAPQPASIEDRKFYDNEIKQAYPDAKTMLDALGERFVNLKFAEGCDYKGSDRSGFADAIKLAAASDVVILAVGEKNGIDASSTSGEGLDSVSLSLPGVQDELVQRIYETNKNMILVHTGCRPLCWEWAYDNIPAILEAWLPCTYGAEAISRVICGEYAPAGRTPVDLPRSAAHSPIYHSQYRGSSSDDHSGTDGTGYVGSRSTSLRPFGYGLSYTDFEYENPTLNFDDNGNIEISLDVRNIGKLDGEEVVQLYGIDTTASMVRPRQELVGFKRVHLGCGETKRIKFKFNIDILSFIGEDGKWLVESGEFRFFVGGHSKDKRIEMNYHLNATRYIDPNKRCFYATAE